jgi:hypothetical protein
MLPPAWVSLRRTAKVPGYSCPDSAVADAEEAGEAMEVAA